MIIEIYSFLFKEDICQCKILIKYLKLFKSKSMENKQTVKFNYDPKWEKVEYAPTSKMIVQFEDVAAFKQTQTYKDLLVLLADLQKSIRSKSIPQTKPIEKFLIFDKYFAKLSQLLEETPPIQQPMRFGNKAFRDWLKKTEEYTKQFLEEFVPSPIAGARDELYRYIVQSFGNNTRIDYGTGHELSFMFFCWSLLKLGYYNESEFEQMVRQVYYQYINFMRKVQLQYNLEPAGSHGVWGLDDYHFLPFLLGASELVGNDIFQTPEYIHKDALVNQYYKDYMYINCIKFIKQAKKGVPFSESSPILDNISGAASWEKVSNGMVKMYDVEVLGKHPVIKHTYFGTIIPYK